MFNYKGIDTFASRNNGNTRSTGLYGCDTAIARAVCGVLAVATAAVLAHPRYPQGNIPHADGWLTLTAVCIAIHAVLFIRKRAPLEPVYQTLLPFISVCAITIALTIRNDFDFLPGIWMIGYGLMNIAHEKDAPKGIRLVGLYYIACGAVTMLVLGTPFDNPWPVGFVFFAGEMLAAVAALLHRLPRRGGSLAGSL